MRLLDCACLLRVVVRVENGFEMIVTKLRTYGNRHYLVDLWDDRERFQINSVDTNTSLPLFAPPADRGSYPIRDFADLYHRPLDSMKLPRRQDLRLVGVRVRTSHGT